MEQIFATFDEEGIFIYQAFKELIANEALEKGTFGMLPYQTLFIFKTKPGNTVSPLTVSGLSKHSTVMAGR
jgi:hypothetical protein